MKITTFITAAIMMTSISSFAQTTTEHPVHQARKEIKSDKQKLSTDLKELKSDKLAGNTQEILADKAEIKTDRQELRHDIKSRVEAKKERRAEHKVTTN